MLVCLPLAPAVSPLPCCPMWLTASLFLHAGSRRQVLSAAECCCVCGLQRPAPTFQQYIDGHSPWGRKRRRLTLASASQKKKRTGKRDPAMMNLPQEDCDNMLQVAFCVFYSLWTAAFTTAHFLIYKSSFNAYLSGSKLVTSTSSFQAAGNRSFLSTHVQYTKGECTLLWKWGERGSYKKRDADRSRGVNKMTIFGLSR